MITRDISDFSNNNFLRYMLSFHLKGAVSFFFNAQICICTRTDCFEKKSLKNVYTTRLIRRGAFIFIFRSSCETYIYKDNLNVFSVQANSVFYYYNSVRIT